MGINVSQFSPPGTVSKLVWDADMRATGSNKYVGDVYGATLTVWLITPKVPLEYISFNIIQPAGIGGGGYTADVYSVAPKETLTGEINCYFTGGVNLARLIFVNDAWDLLREDNITNTPTSYTIPVGTSHIYVKASGSPSPSNPVFYLAKMDIEKVALP